MTNNGFRGVNFGIYSQVVAVQHLDVMQHLATIVTYNMQQVRIGQWYPKHITVLSWFQYTF